jgi:hypothetical protein
MLREKMSDPSVAVSDMDAKRDIMSLLVRARKADLDKGKGIYAMSDQAMMDQVVSSICLKTINILFRRCEMFQLTFLGAGHETTATGLSWVRIKIFPVRSLF